MSHLGRLLRLVVALSLIATLLVIGAPAVFDADIAVADSPPDVGPPVCVIDDDGNRGLGCLDASDEMTVTFAGEAGPGNTVVVNASPSAGPCAIYTETNCYFQVYEPSIGGCVYLADNDPTDVRQCRSSLNLQSPPYAGARTTAVGPTGCKGRFDTTYIYGGDARFPERQWPARAAQALVCSIEYSDAYPRFDALDGPTFFVGSARIRMCDPPVGGANCDNGRSVTARAWVKVDGDLRPGIPDASCEVSNQTGPGGSAITFTNTSTVTGSATEPPPAIEWTFPGGATSAADIVNRTATEPGTYTATIIARANGNEDTATCSADVAAPPLIGGIQLRHDDPTDDSGKFEIGEEFDVILTAGADAGLGDLAVTVDAIGLFAAADNLEVVSGPVPAIVNPTTIAPTGRQSWTWRVKPTDIGRFTLRARLTATDAAGRVVEPVDLESNGQGGGNLEVELAFDPPPDELELTENIDDDTAPPEPQDVRVTVTVTNPDGGPVDGVTFPDDLRIIDRDLVQTTGLPRLVDKAGPFAAGGAAGPVDVGPFTLDPGESRAVDYVLEARDDGKFEVRAEVTYTGGGDALVAIGKERYDINPDALLGIELVNDLPGGLVDGGDSVRVSGYLQNLSTTETVTVDMSTFDAEATGNAHVIWLRDLDSPLSGVCGWIPRPIELEAGERVLLHGSVLTHPDGGTTAEVSYATPEGTVRRIVGEGDAATPEDVPLDADEIIFTAASQTELDFGVDTSVELGTWSTSAYVAGMTVGLISGASEWVVSGVEGIGALLKALSSWENWAAVVEHGPEYLLKAMSWWVQNWVLRSPSQKLVFVAELVDDWAQLAIAAGAKLSDVETQKSLAEAVLPGWFDQVVAAYANNDPFAMGEALGRGAGNAAAEIASCIPFSPKYTGRFAQLAEGRAAQSAADLADARRLASTGAASAVLQQARIAIPNGTRVDFVASNLWGVGKRSHDALRRFASENQLLITLRDRSPGSLRRLAQGFVEKYEFMKLKNVRLDIDGPLGYLDEHADIVAFKKPIPAAEMEQAVQGLPARLQAEIRKRHEKRTKEWNKHQLEYATWTQTGFPSGFRHSTNGGKIADQNSRLPFRLRTVELGGDPVTHVVNGRTVEVPDYSIPEVFVDGEWRGFTGDLDIIDIRRLDGQALSPAEASEVFSNLQDLDGVSLRHGDTMHWIDDPDPGFTPAMIFKEKVNQLSDYFVGGPDRALQYAPDGARAVQLDAEKSFVLQKASGGVAGRTTYATWEGGVQHWTQDWTGVGIVEIDFEYSVANLPMFAAPLDWTLNGDCQARMDRADGSIIRENGATAVLELFENGGWTQIPVDRCRAVSDTGSTGLLDEPSVRSLGTVLPILPQTGLTESAVQGDTSLLIHDLPTLFAPWEQDWFRDGDSIIIGPGTPDEEFRTLVDVDMFRLDRPLDHDHDRNTLVTLAGQVVDPPEPGSTTSGPALMVPLVPARLLDTRVGTDRTTVDGRFRGRGPLRSGTTMELDVTGRGGTPTGPGNAGIDAVVVNVGAIDPTGNGYITVHPCGTRPTASSLNYSTTNIPNEIIAKVSPTGTICLYAHTTTHLITDIVGYIPTE